MASEAKIRTLVVDDEAPARTRLRQLLKDEPDFEIVAECNNGRQAIESIQEHRPDLVFLDVQMPRLNGLEVCQAAAAEGRNMPLVIFVTAYDEYALKAFEVHAIDYLLKPFDRERFERALTRAKDHLRKDRRGGIEDRLLALVGDLEANRTGHRQKFVERLVIKSAGRVFFLKTAEIDWIAAEGNYLRLHAGKESHLIRETMQGLELRLDPDRFLRIHRSHIVNINKIKEIVPWFSRNYILRMKDARSTEIPVSRTQTKRLREYLRL